MKKLLKISLLLAVLCFTVPVYADGDMPVGSKPCTQNCGLYDGTTTIPNDSDEQKSDENKQDDSTINEIYSWIYEQISELVS